MTLDEEMKRIIKIASENVKEQMKRHWRAMELCVNLPDEFNVLKATSTELDALRSYDDDTS